MSAEDNDITTEQTEAPEAAAAEEAPVEAPAPDETPADEPVAEEPAAQEPVAEAPADDEPVAEAPAEEASGDQEPVAQEEPEDPGPASVADAFGPVRVARVFVCERGHRTTTLWGEPDNCQARPLRSGPECGLKLYHITELPEQVQKALNPLKASKKASKKK